MERVPVRPLVAGALLASLTLGCTQAAPPEPADSASGRSISAGSSTVPVPEAFSLSAEPLVPPELDPEVRAAHERNLAEARARVEESPEAPESLIWLGRRLGYLGRYREAVAIFTRGIREHPEDARFLRHRGHRFLTLRRLDLAEADLERAAALERGRPDRVEPDGLPNERGIPTSTLQSNIWYHLGLARYLQGDFEGALAAYRECREVSGNPDMLVATSYWLHTTLRRLGRDGEAAEVLEPIHPGLDVIENGAYLDLLLLFRGERTPEELLEEAGEPGSLGFATVAYGVGVWHLVHGREAEATAMFERIVEGGQWPAFGHLAAEAELVRPGGNRGSSE